MRKSSQQNVGAATPTKPNVNVKKIAVLHFVELTFLQGEDQPHLKIYSRRREELKVRG